VITDIRNYFEQEMGFHPANYPLVGRTSTSRAPVSTPTG
jgi:hypothetical protein